MRGPQRHHFEEDGNKKTQQFMDSFFVLKKWTASLFYQHQQSKREPYIQIYKILFRHEFNRKEIY